MLLQPISRIPSLVADATDARCSTTSGADTGPSGTLSPVARASTATRAARNARYVGPRPLHPSETFAARRSQAGRLRPVLAYAVIALLAVIGARLLGDSGMAAPLPCGENLPAACAAP